MIIGTLKWIILFYFSLFIFNPMECWHSTKYSKPKSKFHVGKMRSTCRWSVPTEDLPPTPPLQGSVVISSKIRVISVNAWSPKVRVPAFLGAARTARSKYHLAGGAHGWPRWRSPHHYILRGPPGQSNPHFPLGSMREDNPILIYQATFIIHFLIFYIRVRSTNTHQDLRFLFFK